MSSIYYDAKLDKKVLKAKAEKQKSQYVHKGIAAADRILDAMIKRAEDPDDPDLRAQEIIFNKFTSNSLAELIYLENLPKLSTIEDVNKVEESVIEYMANGVITIGQAERIMGICKFRSNSLEQKCIINELQRIQEQAARGIPVQEMLGGLNVDLILGELTSRKLTEEERLSIIKTVKDHLLVKKPD